MNQLENQRLLTHQEVRDVCATLGLTALDDATALFVPKEDPKYFFRYDLLLEVLMFWGTKQTSMKLLGYQGAGKTSLIMQFHAALRYPIIKVVMTSRTEVADLLAKLAPAVDGSGFEVKLGPLVMAAQQGISILFDEYNVGRPETLVGCNALIEGGTQYVEEADLVVTPEEGFRFFAACNPADSSLGFLDRKMQDPSNEDRFAWNLWVPYPTKEQEIPIVESILAAVIADPDEARGYAERFVNVANAVRKLYMGESQDGAALEVTVSTRGLIAWANNACMALMCDRPQPFTFGIQRSMLDRLDRQSPAREAIMQEVATQFGEVVSPAFAAA